MKQGNSRKDDSEGSDEDDDDNVSIKKSSKGRELESQEDKRQAEIRK